MTSSPLEGLFGRESELSAVDRFVASINEGPAALVLEGEAGIGKTSLWWAGVERARRHSVRVLNCRPGVSELQLSYSCLGDLLDGALDGVLPSLVPPQRRALQAALLLSDQIEKPPDFRSIGLALLAVLRAHSSCGPVLVAVDDIQWLDSPSARVLEFALRRLEAEPVRVLASLRTAEGAEPALQLQQTLPRQRLTLGPLSIGALGELLRRRLALTLSRPLLVRLRQTTGGNPFYALEIGHALKSQGDTPPPGHPLPVPATLREVVHEHLGRLPSRTRDLLLAAASTSDSTVSLLVDLTGSEETVLDELERAREAGVIELHDERIRFAHPLLASVLYAGSSLRARRRTHRALADVIRDPEERARHLARAVLGRDAAVAAALEDAAAHARARGAPDSALELSVEALRLTSPEKHEKRMSLTLQAADASVAVGDLERARTLLAGSVAEQRGGPARAQVLRQLARIVDDWEETTRLLEQARAEAPADIRLRIEVERDLASAAWVTGKELSVALRHAREALQLAEKANDERSYTYALAFVVRLEAMAGQPLRDQFLARLYPRRSSADEFVHGARYTWGEILVQTDELTAALEIFEGLHREALELGDFHALGPLREILALVLWRTGVWEEARRLAEESEQAARQSADATALAFALARRAWIEALLGRAKAARAAASEGLTLVARARVGVLEPRLHHALGVLELSSGQPAAAIEHLDSLTSSAWAAGYRDPYRLRSAPDEVEALVALGELERADAVLRPFEQQAEALERRWARGAAARCRGLLAAAAGDFGGASDAFDRALAFHRELSEPYELARTLLAFGVTQRREKKRRAARESLGEALLIFEELGALLWAERVRGEVARIGGRAAAADKLTPTEFRVAELVADGRANKAVAAELFVTVKAVEANLSSAYRKLGIHSRTQLAKRLGELSGTPPKP